VSEDLEEVSGSESWAGIAEVGVLDGSAGMSSISSSSLEDVADEKSGRLKAGGGSSVSSSVLLSAPLVVSPDEELDPIVPTFPFPKPIGRKRIFRPGGCCRTGLLAGTLERF